MKAYIVGGGLAAFAAATYLIRDGGFLANNIFVYEANDYLGGAMGMSGNPTSGYVLPTGRVFEKEFRCALEFFSLVPSASDPNKSIRNEIEEFNARYGYYDKARIIDANGEIIKSKHFGLSMRDRMDLMKLSLTPESMLENKRIEDVFSKNFFDSEFWIVWATLIGCLPEHSAMEMRRFLNRFLHLLPDLSVMTKIYRTRFNQQEAIANPIEKWLAQQGVNFFPNTFVTSVEFKPSDSEITANSLEYERDGKNSAVDVGEDDLVLVTNGSQIGDLATGSMSAAPEINLTGRSWKLWQRLARGRPEFGNPDAFVGSRHINDAKWLSFTVTTTDPSFFDFMSSLTGSEPGRGGLMTLIDTNWLVTLAIFHQPEFIDQPKETMVWWGYALYPERVGKFVKKPMLECSGAEILEEVFQYLKIESPNVKAVEASTCIPCVLPYAFSVFLPRTQSDRAPVVPKGSTNFGFMGQFSEMPVETIFTMEYAVRSARTAISTLLNLKKKPPPIYQPQYDPGALYQAMKALNFS